MREIFRTKFGTSMIACLIVQQVLVAASSWALVDFIRQTAWPQNFHISSIVVLIVSAISPYIPGFISNYFYQLWIVFGRSQTTRNFLKLIDGRKDWVFNTKKRDDVFALQRENIALIDETSRFFYLNFPVVLNLIFNSVAIGFLLGRDIILGMLAGFAISGFQFLLVPFFTEKMQKQKQELHYEAEKSFLGSWQVITLQNQPFYGQSLQSINGNHQKSEVLSRHVHTLETFTNSLVSIASFVPLTLILLAAGRRCSANAVPAVRRVRAHRPGAAGIHRAPPVECCCEDWAWAWVRLVRQNCASEVT